MRSAGRHAGDQDVLHLDLEILQRVLASLAHSQDRRFDVLSVRADLKQFRGGLVHEVREVEILDVDLASAASGSAVECTGLAFAERPAQYINLVLVLVIQRLALDGIEFQENIDSHSLVLSKICN